MESDARINDQEAMTDAEYLWDLSDRLTEDEFTGRQGYSDEQRLEAIAARLAGRLQ
jgi:hypothetical protein